jgi:Ni/Fe-hydrogenase 1 B-type cytochrome subunit
MAAVENAPGSGGAGDMAVGAESAPKKTVYVWDLPVRVTHWTNVICIVVLSFTGYYISNPFISVGGPASDNFLMGAVRFAHFVTAFVFTMSVLFRIYWAFASRDSYARWKQFLPVTSGRWRALRRMLGYYTFLKPSPPAEVGHNPLAGVTYMGLYVLFVLQIVTGFALWSQPFHGGFWPAAFGWMITLFGAPVIRVVHDIIMWLIIAFTIHHVYSAVLIDIEERSGLVSSIVTGSKSLTAGHLAEAAEEDAPRAPRARRARKARNSARGGA